MIATRIGFGARSLAQHIVTVSIALRLKVLGALHRLFNGFAQHEVAPHLLHRPRHCRSDHRLAQALYRRFQMADNARLAFIQHFPRQHQGPGRSIDQRRGRLAQMPPPVRGRDLVLDQRIHRIGIRHPQQSLGQTHQRNAFVGRKPVLGQKNLHQPRLGAAADAAHEIRARCGDPRALGGIHPGLGDQRRHQNRLIAQRITLNHIPSIAHVGPLKISPMIAQV